MAIRIGINGFGRIGRLVFRSAIKQNDVTIVGINDLLDINHLAYLLKYDSVHGKYDGTVEVKGNNLIVDGKSVRISAERNQQGDPAERSEMQLRILKNRHTGSTGPIDTLLYDENTGRLSIPMSTYFGA